MVDDITNKDLTLFVFGCAAREGLTIKGYKHRKSIINIINEKHNIPHYKWDGYFWGPISKDFEAHLSEYDRFLVYVSSLCYEEFKEGESEPIHHKSKFLIKGINWWLQTYNYIKSKNGRKFKEAVLDAITYSSFDNCLIVNYALDGKEVIKERKTIKSQNVLYPLSWYGKIPTDEEIEWLKDKYQKWGINVEKINPLKIEIPEKIIEKKFAYLYPEKQKGFSEYKKKAKNDLNSDIRESSFILEMLNDKYISEEEIFNRFEMVSDELSKALNSDLLSDNYHKELSRIKKTLANKEIYLDFKKKIFNIFVKEPVEDNYFFRYCWHIVQPLELIHFKRECPDECK